MNGIQDKEFIQELITGDEDPDRSVKGIVSTLERNSSTVCYKYIKTDESLIKNGGVCIINLDINRVVVSCHFVFSLCHAVYLFVFFHVANVTIFCYNKPN